MKTAILLATALSASVLATPTTKRNNNIGDQITDNLPHLGPTQPACGPACLGQAQNMQSQCGPFDLSCFCQDYQIQAYLSNCLNKTCFPGEVEGANGFLTGFCGLVNGYKSM